MKTKPLYGITVNNYYFVASHIQCIGYQPERTIDTLHGGQSRSWSAEQGNLRYTWYVFIKENLNASRRSEHQENLLFLSNHFSAAYAIISFKKLYRP